jgi:hypothetical protein
MEIAVAPGLGGAKADALDCRQEFGLAEFAYSFGSDAPLSAPPVHKRADGNSFQLICHVCENS